jgi:pentatricopeptide repeat protein
VAEALLQVAFPLRLPGLTAIMGRFTKSGQWAISLDIFDTLPALALPRDTTVCNAALAACMRGCLWQRAKQAFDLMIAQGVPLDNITYYTMLSVPRRRKLWRVTMDVRLC